MFCSRAKLLLNSNFFCLSYFLDGDTKQWANLASHFCTEISENLPMRQNACLVTDHNFLFKMSYIFSIIRVFFLDNDETKLSYSYSAAR